MANGNNKNWNKIMLLSAVCLCLHGNSQVCQPSHFSYHTASHVHVTAKWRHHRLSVEIWNTDYLSTQGDVAKLKVTTGYGPSGVTTPIPSCAFCVSQSAGLLIMSPTSLQQNRMEGNSRTPFRSACYCADLHPVFCKLVAHSNAGSVWMQEFVSTRIWGRRWLKHF